MREPCDPGHQTAGHLANAGLLAVLRLKRAFRALLVTGADQWQIDAMAFQPAKLGGDALARRDEFAGFRVGLRADQEEGGKPGRRILFSLVIRRRSGNQCADQLASLCHTIFTHAAAMRIAEQESAISRDAVGIGNTRAGDQQGCDSYCGGGHCFGSPSLLILLNIHCCDLVAEPHVLDCLFLQRIATTAQNTPLIRYTRCIEG